MIYIPGLVNSPYVKPKWLKDYEADTIKAYAKKSTPETVSFYAAKASWHIANGREHSRK